jgi:hypothetical protein
VFAIILQRFLSCVSQALQADVLACYASTLQLRGSGVVDPLTTTATHAQVRLRAWVYWALVRWASQTVQHEQPTIFILDYMNLRGVCGMVLGPSGWCWDPLDVSVVGTLTWNCHA